MAFEALEFTHQLEASGVPRAQAEVNAGAMTAMFLLNFDALVTRDYLDSRFTEFEARVEAKLGKRLAEFAVGLDERFAAMETDIKRRFAAVDVRFERIECRFNLVYWMQCLTVVCVVIPLGRAFHG